jgi:serine/threonine protein kinase
MPIGRGAVREELHGGPRQLWVEKHGYGYRAVFKATKKSTNETVALKRLNWMKDEPGFPASALREISLLQRLQHPNVVRFLEVVTASPAKDARLYGGSSNPHADNYDHPHTFFIVCEYAEHSLKGLLNRKITFTDARLKCLMRQILEGVSYMHKQGVMHRDLKGSNILLTKDGIVKIADLGMGKRFNLNPETGLHQLPGEPIATLWYRAPELLLGAEYTAAIDLWAVGCVFAELVCGEALFPGLNEEDQLRLIINTFGLPDEAEWPELASLTRFRGLKSKNCTVAHSPGSWTPRGFE